MASLANMNTNYGFTISSSGLGTGELHVDRYSPSEPKDLIKTRAVQTIDGWAGQILVAGVVAWQSEPVEPTGEDDKDDKKNKPEVRAVKLANERALNTIARLFAA